MISDRDYEILNITKEYGDSISKRIDKLIKTNHIRALIEIKYIYACLNDSDKSFKKLKNIKNTLEKCKDIELSCNDILLLPENYKDLKEIFEMIDLLIINKCNQKDAKECIIMFKNMLDIFFNPNKMIKESLNSKNIYQKTKFLINNSINFLDIYNKDIKLIAEKYLYFKLSEPESDNIYNNELKEAISNYCINNNLKYKNECEIIFNTLNEKFEEINQFTKKNLK